MGILGWLFRRKKKCPSCGFDLSKITAVTSAVHSFRCPMCGANVAHLMNVVDMRPDSEKQVELQAQSDLGGENESFAQRLVYLQSQSGDATAKTEIRRIGEQLGDNGGHGRMALVAYRVEYLGGSSRQLEYAWAGICGWRP